MQVEVKYTRKWNVAERAIQSYNQRAVTNTQMSKPSAFHSWIHLSAFYSMRKTSTMPVPFQFAESLWRQKNQIMKRNQKPCLVHCNNRWYPFCLKFCYELLTTVKALRWHCIKHCGYAESKAKVQIIFWDSSENMKYHDPSLSRISKALWTCQVWISKKSTL